MFIATRFLINQKTATFRLSEKDLYLLVLTVDTKGIQLSHVPWQVSRASRLLTCLNIRQGEDHARELQKA
ncbi:hypothetical protein EMIT0P260_110127 [Pseudomonas sp. IT-P260]